MGTNYGSQGPQEPPWQERPAQVPPWMQSQQSQSPSSPLPPVWAQQPQQGAWQPPLQPTQQGPMYLPPPQMQPGQNFQPPLMPPPPKKKHKLRTGCIIGFVILILGICGIFGAAMATTAPKSLIGAKTTSLPTQGSVPIHVPTHAIPTPVPTLKPTSSPTKAAAIIPTATPTAKPQPTQPPVPTPVPQLAIQFTSAINEDVAVHTLPGAALTIKVLYQCSGHYATSQSLQGTSYADSGGNMTWTWTNQSKCHGGVTATVVASLNGKTVSNSAGFTD